MILQDYLDYTQASASPESYHIWVYLSMVSSILGKRAWVRCNYFNVYPNLYVMLTSMPGVGKKSTAMRIGRNTVKAAELEPPPRFSNDSQTPQALMNELVESYRVHQTPAGKMYGSSPLTVVASELVSLLFNGPVMVDFLTDIYDSDSRFEYKTKNMGELVIDNPCLNILTGITTDTFKSRIIRDATAGGFLSRSIIVYDTNIRESSAFDLPTAEQEEAHSRVIERFSQLGDVYGEFGFSQEAIKMFKAMEKAEHIALQQPNANAEFKSRKPINTLKAALLLAAAELKQKVDEEDMAAAMMLMDKVEHNYGILRMSMGDHKNAEIHERVLTALGHYGQKQVEMTEVYTAFMGSADQKTIDDAIRMLEMVNYVKITTDTSQKPPTQHITLTNLGKSIYDKHKR